MGPVAGGDDLVDHADWRAPADLGILIFRIHGQVVLDILHVPAEELKLRGFGVVPQIDVGFVGRFIAEQLVIIGFVRPDSDIERRIQIHPGDVARVVVI